jgi:cytochrome o ubiquinol oxidase subunit 1
MAALCLAAVVATVIARSFMRDVTRIIPAATVEAVDRRWLAHAHSAQPIPRSLEQSEQNEGLAQWMA